MPTDRFLQISTFSPILTPIRQSQNNNMSQFRN